MTDRAFLLPFAMMTALVFACAKPIRDGNACFQSSECGGGSACARTAYGNYCLELCSVDTVRCEDGASCLQSGELGPAPDAGIDAGVDAGTDADAGTEDQFWVCLPAKLENPSYVPRDLGQICDASIDCLVQVGLICVCIPGATCEPGSEGRNGPTCQRLCDPAVINQCPQVLDLQPQCTDLGDGRGFCDPTTLPVASSSASAN
jgi:hypothetical protein